MECINKTKEKSTEKMAFLIDKFLILADMYLFAYDFIFW